MTKRPEHFTRLATFESVLCEATGLVSSGENPEYDRALIELIVYSFGGNQDDFLFVSCLIFGVERPDLWRL